MRHVKFAAPALLAATLLMFGTAAGAPSNADRAIAKTGLLTPQDFPAGWTVKPGSSSSGGPPPSLVACTPACRPFISLLGNSKSAAKAQSDEFTEGSVTVTNSVDVYPSPARANAPFNAVKTSSFSSCLQVLFAKLLHNELASKGEASALQHASVVATSANPGITLGDDQAAYSLALTASVQGTPINIYFEDVVIRNGRALDSFSFENDTSPITDVMKPVLAQSVRRLRLARGLPPS